MKQLKFFKAQEKAYGGELLKTRKGRAHGRPLATRSTMHLVLRSSKARGEWSFRRHEAKIESILAKFAKKNGVKLLKIANVGNHIHLHIQLTTRHTYRAFIRAVTAAIAMAVTGTHRWKPQKIKFWDYRPFTRIVQGFRAYLNLKDYLVINQLESYGLKRGLAREEIAWQKSYNTC